jgi:hypothetical protein
MNLVDRTLLGGAEWRDVLQLLMLDGPTQSHNMFAGIKPAFAATCAQTISAAFIASTAHWREAVRISEC